MRYGDTHGAPPGVLPRRTHLRQHLQVHAFDQLPLAEGPGQVLLVPQDQQRDAGQRIVLAFLRLQQVVQLVARQFDGPVVCGIHDEAGGRTNRGGRWPVRCWWRPHSGAAKGLGPSRTHTMAFTPLQYRSHMLRKRVWPPKSHS